MNRATPLPWPELFAGEDPRTTFRASFEHAPMFVVRCNSQGFIVEMNPAFRRMFGSYAGDQRLRLADLISPRQPEKSEALLQDLLSSKTGHISIESTDHALGAVQWTAWRHVGRTHETDQVLLIGEAKPDRLQVEEVVLQRDRWEAIGRLAGGAIHDFNNLLTGVMLYCDLILSSLDARDRRRRYAEEIRSAVVQATGLVRQLLVFARPQTISTRLLSLNDVVEGMRDLLTRLIGENVSLKLRLDPELGVVNIDQTQVQQILLNLVLNARDALPKGGQITVETSNCRFQPVTGTVGASGLPAFPCVLLAVSDDGEGMSTETRRRLFEPFFTTKNAGQGTGLGLTTVRSIVTTNRGLIHFESEAGHGTRVLILLPRASPAIAQNAGSISDSDPGPSSAPLIQETKKETLL